MALVRVTALALMLVSTAWSSHPFELTQDQYEAREDRLHPPQLLREATDHLSEVHITHSFEPIKKTSSDVNVQLIVPEMQVGCADGLIHDEKSVKKNSDQNKINLMKKSRRRRDVKKQKRSYYRWSGQTIEDEPYQSISVWKPQTYQISRPYYVPIFGVSGRVPIYYPPQPLAINPGIPPKNPVKKPSFQAPSYLPPGSTTTSTPTNTMMTIKNRFNDDDKDEASAWVWESGSESSRVPSVTSTTRRPESAASNAIVPTRRPRPPGVPKTIPPLLHNPQQSESSNSEFPNTFSSQSEAFAPPPNVAARPPPRTTARTTTTTPPPQQQQSSGPSRCVWAIISCCSASSTNVSYDCFDQLGCPGAFWDNSPCESDFAKAAIASALNYYNK